MLLSNALRAFSRSSQSTIGFVSHRFRVVLYCFQYTASDEQFAIGFVSSDFAQRSRSAAIGFVRSIAGLSRAPAYAAQIDFGFVRSIFTSRPEARISGTD